MTPTLAEIGRNLYGPRWRTDLRRGLNALGYRVSQPTVDRWSGDEPPPPKWAEPIGKLVAARRMELERLG
jgi:hypothetical protein